MCSDPERAKQNREIVAKKLYTEFWIRVEHAIATTPRSKPLPKWVPQEPDPIQCGRTIQPTYGGDYDE